MSLADAFRKAGVVTEEQYNKHQEKIKQKTSQDELLRALGAKTQFLSYYLGQMEQIPTMMFDDKMLRIAESLGRFATKFKDHPQVRKSIDFHLSKIREKQKWKLDIDYADYIGVGLPAAILNIKASTDQHLVWAIRATGYALCGVLEAHPRYSTRTKQEVLDWVKANAADLNLN